MSIKVVVPTGSPSGPFSKTLNEKIFLSLTLTIHLLMEKKKEVGASRLQGALTGPVYF